MHSLYGYWNKP